MRRRERVRRARRGEISAALEVLREDDLLGLARLAQPRAREFVPDDAIGVKFEYDVFWK